MSFRVQAIVSEKLEHISERLVRSGARDDVDDPARGFAKLGGVRIRQHLKFLDRFLAERGSHRADDGVIVVHAVDHDVVRASALTAKRQARRRRCALLGGAIERHARRDHAEAEEIAAVGGQRVDLFLTDDRGDRRLRRIDHRRPRSNHDRLSGSGTKREVHFRELPDL